MTLCFISSHLHLAMSRIGDAWTKTWFPVGCTFQGPLGGVWELRSLQHDADANKVVEEWVCTKEGGVSSWVCTKGNARRSRRRAYALLEKAHHSMAASARVKKKALKTLLRAKAMRAIRRARKLLRKLDN